jgi:hypothetical protein
MDYAPELVHYGAAREMEVRCFAMAKAGSTATVVIASKIEGWVVGDSVTVEKEDGTVLAAAVISAISRTARTLTFTGPGFSVAPPAGSTLVGPVRAALGGTDGGIHIADKPDMVNVEYDNIEGNVRSIPVHHAIDITFNLKELRLDQWGLMSQTGVEERAAATGVVGGHRLHLGGGQAQHYGFRFYIPDTDPTVTLETVFTAYDVASMAGIETAFAKRDPSANPVTLSLLADPSRPRFQRFGTIFQQTSPAL